MKPTTLLLILSLLGNVAAVAFFVTPRSQPSAAPAPSAPSVSATPSTSSADDALRAALASGDAAALEAVGVSPEVARELALGRAISRLAERLRANKSAGETAWWKNRPSASGSREQYLVARRELSDALTAAYGDDLGLLGTSDQAQLAFLPGEKRSALRRIIQDYDEMMAKFSGSGIQLASDRERLRLLRAERDRDIAALLTPEELTAYEMRTSPSGAMVRNRYGDAIESEAEFAKIYALQKAFDEKFPREAMTGRISPETLRARSEAERQLEAEIRAAVGEERYAELRRASDFDLRTIETLAERLNLPATTADQVARARENFASESQRISSDPSLTAAQRRAQVQDLAARAKSELAQLLGGEGADAYAQRSQWLNMLQSGMAYSTTPPADSPATFFRGNQSVYPVMPAGAIGPGAARQMIINAAPGIDAGTFEMSAGASAPLQVMTFTSATLSDPAGQPGQRVIVQPSPAPQPPSQPSTATPAVPPKQ